MSMTIEIAGDLEPILKAEASKAGVDPKHYTDQLLRASLHNAHGAISPLSADEARLLKQINDSLSPDEMDVYQSLIRKRQQETITEAELRELQELTHRMETLQVQRLDALAKLAAIRNVPLPQLMARLEITPPDIL